MSHFSVVVRVPVDKLPRLHDRAKINERLEEHLEPILTEMLLPYKNPGCGDSDPEGLEKHLEFEDKEDEFFKEYNEGTIEQVRLEDGSLVSTTDDRFKVQVKDFLLNYSYKVPGHLCTVQVPFKEVYPTFEKFCEEWHGYSKRDPKKKRYGHWSNPNQKWDWWCIGGRWNGYFSDYDPSKDKENYSICWLCKGTGSLENKVSSAANDYSGKEYDPFRAGNGPFPCKPGATGCNSCYGSGYELKFPTEQNNQGNYISVGTLIAQRPVLEQRMTENMDKFWEAYQEMANGKDFPFFEGTRDRAIRFGWVTCKDEAELDGTEWKTKKWKDEKRNRYDVFKEVSYQELLAFRPSFFSMMPFAYLDSKGWHENGEMGWWCHVSTDNNQVQSYIDYVDKELFSGNPDDVLVCVDCHI